MSALLRRISILKWIVTRAICRIPGGTGLGFAAGVGAMGWSGDVGVAS